MPTVQVQCIKYYRNSGGVFWLPGEVYEMDRSNVYEFTLSLLRAPGSEIGKIVALADMSVPGELDLTVKNIGIFFEYFSPVDRANFDKEILGIKNNDVIPVFSPTAGTGQRADGMKIRDLIDELLRIESEHGPAIKVFTSDSEYGDVEVKCVSVQEDDGFFVSI